jgi:hypothetical protein
LKGHEPSSSRRTRRHRGPLRRARAGRAGRSAGREHLARQAEGTGAPGPGLNLSFFSPTSRTPSTCAGADPTSLCDETLVHIDSTDDLTGAVLNFRLDGFQTADFDLRVYESDETGEPLNYLGSPDSDNAKTSPAGSSDPRNTFLGDAESKSIADPFSDGYYLVQIVYFMVPPGQTYDGHVSLTPAEGAAGAPASSGTTKKRAARARVRVAKRYRR